MTWFLFCLLSVMALAVAELTQQHLLNRNNSFSPRASAVFTFLIQGILISAFLVFPESRKNLFTVFDPVIFPQVIAVTMIASVAMIFYLKSFQVKIISFSTIFISASAVVSSILGIIFFGEDTGWLKFFGIFLILGAIAGLNFKNMAIEKNHLYGLLSAGLFGICYTLDKSIVGRTDLNIFVYIFWSYPLVAFWAFLVNPNEIIGALKSKSVADFKPIIISAAAYLMFNVFTFMAYAYDAEVGKVDAINNSQVFLIILFEYFVLKHSRGWRRKLLAAAVAYCGVFILGFY